MSKPVKISHELHRLLKVACAQRGITLRAAVEQAVGLLLAAWEREDARSTPKREWGTE